MRPDDTVDLSLSYDELDTLVAALDMASIHTPHSSLYRRDGSAYAEHLVSAWRSLERRLGEILGTDLDDPGPAEPESDEYRSGPVPVVYRLRRLDGTVLWQASTSSDFHLGVPQDVLSEVRGRAIFECRSDGGEWTPIFDYESGDGWFKWGVPLEMPPAPAHDSEPPACRRFVWVRASRGDRRPRRADGSGESS